MAEINKIYGVNQSNFFFNKLYQARTKLFNKIINYIPEGSKIIDVGTTPVIDKHEKKAKKAGVKFQPGWTKHLK